MAGRTRKTACGEQCRTSTSSGEKEEPCLALLRISARIVVDIVRRVGPLLGAGVSVVVVLGDEGSRTWNWKGTGSSSCFLLSDMSS